LGESIAIVFQHVVDALDLQFKLREVSEPEEDDTGVRLVKPEDQITEVVVIGNQDSTLLMC